MVSAPANVRRHFLPWDRPLLGQAVAFLAQGWSGEGALDLSRLLVVVPTAQSGRRLREALANLTAAKGQAAFPPRVLTPDALIASGLAPNVASRLESLLAWSEIFRELELEEFREVFPVDPPARNFAWALRLAGEFVHLQSTLAEAGLRIADVSDFGRCIALSEVERVAPNTLDRGMGFQPISSTNTGKMPVPQSALGATRSTLQTADFPEAARWVQLGELERRYVARLERRGLSDAQAAKISAAQDPAPLAGVEKIVVLATPDPLPLALTALAARAPALPVDIVVFAPPSEAGSFDDWGRPVAKAWETRVLALADFERDVHICADPAAQADRITAAARAYGVPDGRLAAGVADPEVLPPLESALGRAGIVAFNPEGRPRRRDGLYQLLSALAALAREPGFAAVEALGRCPDILTFLAARVGPSFSPARWLEGLDELHERHLPGSLAAARAHAPALEKFPELVPALAAIEEVRAALTAGDFPAATSAALALIFGDRSLDLARAADARLEASAAAWTEVLGGCAGARRDARRGQVDFIAVAPRDSNKIDLTPSEWWDLALQLFGDARGTDDKPAGALELQGWLELLWEDAPHLMVAGFNDGCVPDAVVGDPFLPEALRARLGLKTNAARFARDLYLLSALAASRARDGRLDLLVGRVSATGEPLRPSRLLLRCDNAELPRRVEFLFQAAPAERPSPPWRRAWRLRPRMAPPLRRLRVTAFSDYLKCPFRFYLKHVLRLEGVDPQKSELDALAFGTLCHGALEAMGNARSLRDCTDAALLRAFLIDALERGARARFGRELTLPLVIQLESARQRLSRAAEVQAEQRAQGWIIEEAEKKFTVDIGGIEVNGKIDRIERQAETGLRRILDYKTSDNAVSPFKAHCHGASRAHAAAPEWARFTSDGAAHVWTDLQLPLYLQALAGSNSGDLPNEASQGSVFARGYDATGCAAPPLGAPALGQTPSGAEASGLGATRSTSESAFPPKVERVAPNTLSGYFNLPKAVGETGVALWEDYSPDLHAAAMRCAEGVSAAIQAGIFWPPAEPGARDEELFSGFFHHGTAESVDPAFYEKR